MGLAVEMLRLVREISEIKVVSVGEGVCAEAGDHAGATLCAQRVDP